MRCARCGRKVAKPVNLAGLWLGPTCLRRVEGYVTRKKAPREEPVYVDPRQTGFDFSDGQQRSCDGRL